MASTKSQRTPQREQDFLSRIFTLGDIDNESSCEIIGLINEVNKEDERIEPEKRKPIKLIINSPGGEVYSGIGVIDTIESSITPIHTYVTGHAMSMAFAIATAGHYRYASKRSTFMYHEISWDVGYSKMRFHEQELIEGKRLWKIYDDVVVQNTKIPLKTLEAARKEQKDWYMSVEEALKWGVIDEII